MKPIAFLLLIACLQRSITGYCQTSNKVSLSEKNASLESILIIICHQTGLNYGGTGPWTELAHPVTISVNNTPYQEALSICFKGQPLNYEIVDGQISIHIANKKEYTLKGTIRNEKEEPVPGASISSKGTGKRSTAISDENGDFSIMLNRQDTSLVFSSINYEPKEVSYNGEDEIAVHVKTKIIELAGAIVAHTGIRMCRRKEPREF